MSIATGSTWERDEVDCVLQSGILDKSPRLKALFCYLCEQYFAGRGDQVKEYSIAIEALGRSAEFDPKKDSIVRVEAHRLRKRLERYYQAEGAPHAVRISLPNGQYRPFFTIKDTEPEKKQEPFADLAHEPLYPASDERVIPSAGGRNKPTWLTLAVVVLFVVVVAGASFSVRHYRTAAPNVVTNEIWTGAPMEPSVAEFRMLAGYHGAPTVDRQGHVWNSDAYYQGGASKAISSEHLIEGGPDSHLLKGQRTGRFRYDIPLRPGTYELHLYFAETEYGDGNPGGGDDFTRLFRVSINGVARLTALNVLSEAGAPNRSLGQVFKDITPAADGKLHLNFEPGSGSAFLNAVEILPSAPGRVHPIRIVAQPNPLIDSDGRLWAADEYFCGGVLTSRRNMVFNSSEKTLYRGERYGNFSYRIPLAPGKYRLTLHFAETWWGTPESNAPAIDNRIFNVFANGATLLHDYQVAKEAGGPNRSVKKIFDNIRPNEQGVLLLEFIPVRNYAEVNAIEVVETG